ncbi:MAG TPA: hypothetical protein VK841_10650 [Polyangiaceae bacterium]|jgi:hypothetical protein|nr:hypothetical protein [Polyangiaceae bacterium]
MRAALVLLVLCGCSREVPRLATTDPVATPTAPVREDAGHASPAAASAPILAARNVAHTTLAGVRVNTTLPEGWKLLAAESDEATGLVAFGPDDASGAATTAFLDGSQIARMPGSLAQAQAQALARHECPGPNDCSVLGAEALPGGGFLVTVRASQDLLVQSWRAVTADHPVRCGFDAPSRTKNGSPASWLGDPNALARVRAEGEGICRSVAAPP